MSFVDWVLDGTRFVLDWLDSLPEGRKALFSTLIATAIATICSALVLGVRHAFRKARFGILAWWKRRKESQPSEERLGFYDHDERIRRLWADLTRIRRRLYGTLSKIGPVGKMFPDPGRPFRRATVKAVMKKIRPSLRAITKVADD
jgi:hypothetical protein